MDFSHQAAMWAPSSVPVKQHAYVPNGF